MKVQNNKVVAVSYALEVEGRIADQSAPGAPLEYIHGTGMLLPKFEAALLDKEPGDGFDFVLSPEDGYGVYEPNYKFDIPKSAFAIDGKVREDLLVIGRAVTMDFNHPMAGKTLHFTGKVESVRSATDKELTEGLHGEYLPPEEHECPHGKGGCHKEDGECCHEGGHQDGECCGKGEGCCHKD